MSEKDNYGITKSLVERIKNALDMNLKTQIKKIFSSLHPADQADLICSLDTDERKKLIEVLNNKIDPSLIVELSGDVRDEILGYLDKETIAGILTKLDTDEAVEILEDFEDADLTNETLESIKSSEKREDIEEALSYPEDSVGRIMDQDNFIAIPKDWNVSEILKYLRKNKNVPQEVSSVVVVDEYYRPVSVASIGNILQNDEKTLISQIMKDPEDLKILNVNMDQADAANIFIKYDLKFVPVVNENGILTGILNSNDIMHVINEESNEDMMLMASVDVDDDIHTPILTSVRKRLPWLIGSILTASLSSIVINYFSGTIEKLVILSALIPPIANLSGVSGNQTLSILIRNIANKSIENSSLLKVILKQALTGLLDGFFLALITIFVIYFWKRDFGLSVIFAITVMVLQAISCFVGSVIPIIIHKLKLDPAIGSGTFITAFLDTLSALMLLGMATMFLLS